MDYGVTRTHFDGAASDYPTDFSASHTQYLKWKLIRQHVKPGYKCLDVGAANGRYIVPACKQLEAHGFALDIAPDMLARATMFADDQGVALNCIQASGEYIPLKDNSMDTVICYSALLFVENDVQCLNEMRRVLKPGGTMIVDVHGPYNLGIHYWRRYYRNHGMKLTCHSMSETRDIIHLSGLECLEMHATGVWMQFGLLPVIGKYLFPPDKSSTSDASVPDFDRRLSNFMPRLANRWFVVARKPLTGSRKA